jgi:hypothetical protein
MRVHILREFLTYLLVRIHQKKKTDIALEIAAKIASINGPYMFTERFEKTAYIEKSQLHGCRIHSSTPE